MRCPHFQRPFVIGGRVQVQIQPGIFQRHQSQQGRAFAQKILQRSFGTFGQAPELRPRQEHRMFWFPLVNRLADRLRLGRRPTSHRHPGGQLQMRLISQRDGPMGQVCPPTWPPGGATEGLRHVGIGIRVHHATGRREIQAIQCHFQLPRPAGVNHHDLVSPQASPQLQQVAQHRRLPPGQQEFGAAHPPGLPGRQNDESQ